MVADKHALLTVRMAAEIYKVHPATIRRWVHQGKLPAVQMGGGPIRVVAPHVESWNAAIPASEHTES